MIKYSNTEAPLLRLGKNDFIRGAIIAVLGAVLAIVQTNVEAGSLHFDWPVIGRTAFLTLLAYLTKNLLSNSDGHFGRNETPPKKTNL